jgi:hypothetical protein
VSWISQLQLWSSLTACFSFLVPQVHFLQPWQSSRQRDRALHTNTRETREEQRQPRVAVYEQRGSRSAEDEVDAQLWTFYPQEGNGCRSVPSHAALRDGYAFWEVKEVCVYQFDAAGVPQILVKRFLTFVSRTISVFPPHLGPSICCNLVTSIRLRGHDGWCWWLLFRICLLFGYT